MQIVEHKGNTTTKGFDSLSYAKSMESVGFTRQQAEMLAEKQAELIDERLATKADIELIRADIQNSRSVMKADADLLRAELLTVIEKTKLAIILWVVGTVSGLLFAQTGLILGVIKFHT